MNIPENNTEIPVLSAEYNKTRKKQNIMDFLPVILISAIVIIAVIVTVSIVKTKKANKDEPSAPVTENAADLIVPSEKKDELDTTPVTFMEDVEISFEGLSSDFSDMITEHAFNATSPVATKPEVKQTTTPYNPPAKTTAPQITTKEHLEATTVVTTENTEQNDKVLNVINSFFNRVYYFDGEMISGGESTPLEIAMNKDDFQMFSEIEGKDISFMMLSGKMYMLNPDTKKYTEFSASVQKMMGIDSSDFKFEFNNANFDGKKPNSVTKATFKGQEAVCYTYMNDENKMEFICVDDEIKQMTLFDSDSKAKTVLVADEFSLEIPEEMMNFKGYSKTNIISFMSSLM